MLKIKQVDQLQSRNDYDYEQIQEHIDHYFREHPKIVTKQNSNTNKIMKILNQSKDAN